MAGVILVLGPEPFLAREAVRTILKRHKDHDVARYDGGAVVVGQVLDEMRTPSLFGKARLIVVRDASPLLEGEALTAVADYASKPVGDGLLVLQASGLDGCFKEAKRLKAAAEVVACQPLQKEWEVEQWIGTRGRAHGLDVRKPAAQALRERIGEDLGLLDAALARLADQIAPRKDLQPQDIESSTEAHRSPAIFEAGNAVENRDLPAALSALDSAFGEGIRIHQTVVTDTAAIAPILMGSLHRTYTRLLRFHLARAAGDGEQDAARAAGVSPRAVQYFLPSARRWRIEPLLEGHTRFVETDVALKRTGADPRRLMERLIVDVIA